MNISKINQFKSVKEKHVLAYEDYFYTLERKTHVKFIFQY